MVKNLPAVERSTKIRFGKHVPDSTDQAENTIVFNASNTLVPTINENAVYLSPIRNRPDYTEPQIVLLMYDKNTKEITESGESANALVGGATLALTVDRANVTSNTVQFRFADNNTGFVTDSNVGISNLLPQHTVSVGSNLYIDEFGSNVLVVSGNVAILRDLVVDGNLRVNGDTTVIYTENTAIKDALIELGQNNTSADTTLDLGILMHRPDALSNVVIGYREGTDEFAIGYTDANPTDKTFTPKTDEDINVHVYGLTHVDANIYAHEDILVSGNVYVAQNVSVTEELTISGNVYAQKDLEVVGNVVAYKDLSVSGNVYVTQNVSITEELTVSGNVYTQKDLEVVGNVVAYKDLLVSGNVYVSQNVSVAEELTVSGNVYAQKDLEVVGNVVAYKDLLVSGNVHVSQNVSVAEELTVSGNVYAQKDLEVVGNVYVDGNVVAYRDLLVSGNIYASQNVFVTEELTVSGNVYTQKDLEVVGNTYVSGNVVAYKDLLVSGNAYVSQNVFVTEELTVSGNVYAQKDLEVVGNVVAYKDLLVSGNVHVSQNVSITEELTVSGNVYAQKDLEVVGNVMAYKDLLVSGNAYVTGNVSVTEELIVSGNVYAQKDLEVVGNVVAYKDLLVSGNVYALSNVDVSRELNVTGNVYAFSNVDVAQELNVAGNVYASSNVVVTGNVHAARYYGDGGHLANVTLQVVTNKGNTTSNTVQFTNPTTAFTTDLTSNVGVNIGQLNNVTLTTPLNEDMLVYDGTQWVNQKQNHLFLYAKANVALTKGEVVYATDTVGNDTFVVDRADARDPRKMPAIGILYQDLALNGQGLVVSFGRADGAALDSFGEGETVYVSNTVPGGLSNVAPTGVYNGVPNLIQNVGLVVKPHPSQGIVSVTGVGRVNAIPNANVITETPTYVYTDSTAGKNTLNKIDPVNLLTKLQTLAQVVNTGNTVSNTINVTGLTTTGNLNVTSNISVTGLVDPNNKYLPMVDTNGYFVKSPVYVTNEGKYVISAGEAEFLGNITLGGNTTIISSTSVTIEDRIFGVGANNSATGLDSGFMIEHQDDGTFANVALIHHADEHRFSIGYTQNTFTDNHILYKQHDDGTLLRIELHGNLIVQNNLSVSETGTFDGRVGVKTVSPGYDLDVWGTANVGVLTATTVSAENVKGTVVTGSTLYGTLEGSNTASVSDLTASGTIKGAAVTGTTLYGTLAGSNTASVSDLTASGTVKGVTLTGTNLYGTLAGSNTASVSDLTASGTVKGATLTGTNLYGTLEGSNTASVSDLTASGTVKGATLTGTNLYGTLSGSNTASVSTLTVGGTTQATSTTTGALTVAGGISTQTNVHAANVYISGGLITNTAGVTRKTYAYSGTIGDTEQPHINVCFTNESFSAKIDAQLIEGDDEISAISLVCCGGNKSGTFPASDIKTGSVQVFGPASTNAWNVAVVTDKTTVALRPFGALDGAGEYHIFVEYLTAKAAGAVANVVQDTSEEIVFGY